jgi:mRNA-degrading endonuclease YafQ of YafQ-DinJ toxin-antitoxin module
MAKRKYDFSSLNSNSNPPKEVKKSEALFVSVFDTTDAIAQFTRHEARIKQMHEEALAFEYKDDDAQVIGTARAANAQKAVKVLEVLHDKIVLPHKAFTKAVGGVFKRYEAMIKNDVIEIYRSKDETYTAQKRVRERAELEKKRKAQIEVQAKLKKEAELLGMEAPEFNMPQVREEKPAMVKTEKGGRYQKDDLVITIEDVNIIPRKYLKCTPIMTLIKAELKTGNQIPGVSSKKVKRSVFLT